MSGCPMMRNGNHPEMETDDCQQGKALNYHDYLQLEKVLQAQTKKSDIDDEHLFIIVHQVYELWFKQAIYEVNVAREVFKNKEKVDGAKMLDVVKRFQRIVLILKMCNDQMYILETMTPFDFLQFRNYLFPASGFQSWQFRILENLLGVQQERRLPYNKGTYKQAFEDQPKNTGNIENSEKEVSLLTYFDGWLQHTLKSHEPHFKFCEEYKKVVTAKLEEQEKEAKAQSDEKTREQKLEEYKKKFDMFTSILDKDQHNQRMMTGDRRFTQDALFGALMINLYREEPAFHLAHQLLHLLMDVDSLIAKWRFSHMMVVQRMIGSQLAGTGGSTGYQYLRSTVSGERYKVFLDLFNLSAFLLSEEEKPKFVRWQGSSS